MDYVNEYGIALAFVLDLLSDIVAGDKFDIELLNKAMTLREQFKSKEVWLWHDDVRRPPADEGWIWVQDNRSAKMVLRVFNVVACSLDHDLGATPTGDPADDAFLQASGDEDGMDLVRWMVDHGVVPEVVRIHSMNNPAATRMLNYFRDHGYSGVSMLPYSLDLDR